VGRPAGTTCGYEGEWELPAPGRLAALLRVELADSQAIAVTMQQLYVFHV